MEEITTREITTNIVRVWFGNRNIVSAKASYQYNYGQILKFEDLPLPQAYEVHFSNTDTTGTSVTQIGDANGVTIPDAVFLSGQNIYAWIFLHTGADDGETMFKVIIPILKRARPTDLEPTPVQQDAITQAIAALNVAVEQTAEDVISADASAKDSEAWAVGTRGDVPVESDDPTYENNSKYYAGLTAADAEQTAADRVQTGLDRIQTGEDRVQTGLDRIQTGEDRVQTGLDRIQTGEDRVQTGEDRVQTGIDAETATDKAQEAVDAAERAEQSAAKSGYMFFFIDGNGDLIYQRTNNTVVDFYLNEGDLYVRAG